MLALTFCHCKREKRDALYNVEKEWKQEKGYACHSNNRIYSFFFFFSRLIFFFLFISSHTNQTNNNTKHKQISSYTISLCLFKFQSLWTNQTNKLYINLLQSKSRISGITIKLKKSPKKNNLTKTKLHWQLTTYLLRRVMKFRSTHKLNLSQTQIVTLPNLQ